MPLTIPAIPDADAFAPFEDDVGIFTNTKAREVPAKLNAIAQALKVHLNTLWLATATGFINDTVVANLNTALADIQTFTNALETGIDDQLAEFVCQKSRSQVKRTIVSATDSRSIPGFLVPNARVDTQVAG